MTDSKDKKPDKGGFGAMDPEALRKLASMGGRASSGNFKNNPERAAALGSKGGKASGGNFKNNPSRAVEAGRKGGLQSHRRGEAGDD